MSYSVALMKQLDSVDPQLRAVLWTILEEIEQHREASVTKNEFAELKSIVADQVKIQAETREIVKQLGEAQRRTEEQVQRTEVQVQKVEQQISVLASQVEGVRSQVGGLGKSVAYALENEAYRKLPRYLRLKYEIEIMQRLIRTTIGGLEINLFAHAKRAGQDILLVGESVLRLNDVAKLRQVYEQMDAVRGEFGETEIQPLIITHFATPDMATKAEAEGILIVRSYEWDLEDF